MIAVYVIAALILVALVAVAMSVRVAKQAGAVHQRRAGGQMTATQLAIPTPA